MASPTAAKIESTFRSIIAELYRTDNLTDLTVKRVRTAAEEQMSLTIGWFKEDPEWRDRSKTYITDEAERQSQSQPNDDTAADDAEQAAQRNSSSTDIRPTKSRGKKRASEAEPNGPRGKKQKSEVSNGRKLKPARKVIDSDDDASASTTEHDEIDDNEPKNEVEESEMSDVLDDDPPPTKRKKTEKPKATRNARTKSRAKIMDGESESSEGKQEVEADARDAVQSESEMSSLIDEEPVKRTKKAVPVVDKVQKSKTNKKSKDADLTPEDVEVKKLKDWLGKCGVRKMWANELAPYHTPKQKIVHLKQMLRDVGMDGRPSLAKASEIRERRELAEELEETQKFNQQWGKSRSNGRGRSAAEAIADLGIDFDDESD